MSESQRSHQLPLLTPYGMSNDLQLIRRARAGDREAFDALFAEYCPRLMAFANKLTGDTEKAEDLVQDAFLAALTSFGAYRNHGAFFSWLCGIVVRRERDQRRSQKVEPIVAEHTEQGVGIEVREAIDSLAPKHREAFLLVKFLGLTYDEAGTVLQKPAGTVKWLCSEATG